MKKIIMFYVGILLLTMNVSASAWDRVGKSLAPNNMPSVSDIFISQS